MAIRQVSAQHTHCCYLKNASPTGSTVTQQPSPCFWTKNRFAINYGQLDTSQDNWHSRNASSLHTVVSTTQPSQEFMGNLSPGDAPSWQQYS